MRGVVRRGPFAQKFRRVDDDNVRPLFLNTFRRPGKHGRFDDRDFSLTHMRERILEDTRVEPLRRRRRRDGNEHDVAFFHLVLVLFVRLFQCVTDGLVSSRLKVIRVVLPYPTLTDKPDEWLCFRHRRDYNNYCLRAHAAISSQYFCTYSSKSLYG